MAGYKLPYPPVKPNTLIKVEASEGISVTGVQQVSEAYEGLGFYVERYAWVQNKEGKKVESKGQVIFFHDVCPTVEKLTGSVTVNGSKKSIIVGKRLRNPDGTVHHVELELM